MYHVLVWIGSERSSYYYPYAVHFFSKNKMSFDEAVSKAVDVLEREFRVSEREIKYTPIYVGIEEIPDISKEFYVAVEFHEHDVIYKPKDLPEDVEKLKKYRFSFLTYDIDMYKGLPEEKEKDLAEALDKAFKVSREVKIYKTYGGYHIRAKLDREYSFDELMDLRFKADDYERRHIDMLYHRAGLDFLTNFLFNEKHWKDLREMKSYREEEVSPKDLVVQREIELKIRVPKTYRVINGVEVFIEERKMRLRGKADVLTKDFVDQLNDVLNRELEPMIREGEKYVDVLEKFYRGVFIKRVMTVLGYGDKLIIIADEDDVGKLIGRKGSLVREAEKIVGKKIVVTDVERMRYETALIINKILRAVEMLILNIK